MFDRWMDDLAWALAVTIGLTLALGFALGFGTAKLLPHVHFHTWWS